MGVLVDAIRKVNADVKNKEIVAPYDIVGENEEYSYARGYRDGQNFVINAFNMRFEEALKALKVLNGEEDI